MNNTGTSLKVYSKGDCNYSKPYTLFILPFGEIVVVSDSAGQMFTTLEEALEHYYPIEEKIGELEYCYNMNQ